MSRVKTIRIPNFALPALLTLPTLPPCVLSLLAVLACAVASTGCLHLSKNLLEPIDVPPPAHRPFVEYQISPDFTFGTPGGGYIKLATGTKIGRGIMNRLLKRWAKAGYISGFAYVNPKQGDFTPASELRLILDGSVTAESSVALQIVSGLTLLVIPAYGEITYDLIFEGLRTDRGDCRFEAAAKDGIDEWIQILLLPALPFAPVADARTDARLSRHLFSQLEGQGAFDVPVEADLRESPGASAIDPALPLCSGPRSP
jgi:hypothetical protein